MGYLKISLMSVSVVVGTIIAVFAWLFKVYTPITNGVIHLKNAKGEYKILRETKTAIPHIYADDENGAAYA